MSVEVLGTDKVIARLVKMQRGLNNKTVNAMRKVAEDIKEEAKRLVPVDTGSLKNSIRLQVYAQQAGVIKRIGVSAGGYTINPKTGRHVNYAAPVEYGTSKQRAQPFMRPALKKHEHRIPEEIKRVL